MSNRTNKARRTHILREIANTKFVLLFKDNRASGRGKWKGRGTPGAFGTPKLSQNFSDYERHRNQCQEEALAKRRSQQAALRDAGFLVKDD